MLHNKTQVAEPRRRWFISAAAATSVALTLIGGATAWGDSGNGDSPRASPAVSSTSATASNATERGVNTQMALPAYFVGTTSATGDRFGLYREFVQTDVPAGATPAQKAWAAVAVAMKAREFTDVQPYVQPWSGASVRDLTVTPSLITITLSGPGSKGFTAEQTRLGVQALVWTAQAAVGQGMIPVKFAVADGSTSLFATYPTAQTYNRPAVNFGENDLASIWITSPVLHQVFPAGTPVVTEGESCAFEANTLWELKKGGAVIRSGFTTAHATRVSAAFVCRGTWQVRLGVLAAGEYTFRMYEPSMEEGQGIAAETSKTFTVK
jgi:hypothetical protein